MANKSRARRNQLTIEEREALVRAPVGTPGLADLGLTDPGWADLEALSAEARAMQAGRLKDYLAFLDRQRVGVVVEHDPPGVDDGDV